MHVEFTELNGAKITDARIPLRRLFIWCAEFVRLKLGDQREIYVTSVHRPQENSVHCYGRGLDFAVEDMESIGTKRVLLNLKNIVNLLFPYTKSSGEPGYTFIYMMNAGSGGDVEHVRHVHLQMPGKGWVRGEDLLG